MWIAVVAASVAASLLVPVAAPSSVLAQVDGTAPANLAAESVADGVMLRWDAPTQDAESVTGYLILRRRPGLGETWLTRLVADTASTDTAFLDTTATVEGVEYVYRVAAWRGSAKSARSNRADVVYEAPDPEPAVDEPAVVWSARLEVGLGRSSAPAAKGYSSFNSVGSLSPRSFEVDGGHYRVLVLADFAGGGLTLGVTGELATNFTLRIADSEFVASESLVPVTRGEGRYWWPSGDSLWEVGEEVDVSIVLEGSGSVTGRAQAPPAATFSRPPKTHDGVSTLSLRLYFHEADLDVDAARLRDEALEVTGASLSGVVEVAGSSKRSWDLTLAPDGPGPITVALPETTDCADPAAVCAPDGRMLRNRPEVTIGGRATPPPVVEQPGLSKLEVTNVSAMQFQPEQTRYGVQARPGVSEATVTAEADDPAATVQILAVHSDGSTLAPDGTDADPATAGHQIQLSAAGDTLVLVVVTSPDGLRQQVYVVLIAAPASSAASRAAGSESVKALKNAPVTRDSHVTTTPALSGLTLTGATLSPAFASATTSYTATAAADTSQVTVGATAPAGAAVFVAPNDADTGTAGHQVALAEPLAGGEATTTNVAVLLRSPDGTKLNAYIITVTRTAPAGADATLGGLTVSGVTLSPAFDAGTYAYTGSAASSVAEVTVTATANDSDATAVITPADASTAGGHQVSLEPGANPITVTVTADDDTTTRTYTVDIYRGPSNDASLKSLALSDLTLSPAFDAGITQYTASAPIRAQGENPDGFEVWTTRPVAGCWTRPDTHGIEWEFVTVVAEPTDAGADVEISPQDAFRCSHPGKQVLLPRANTINVVVTVTARNGTTRDYVVTVSRSTAGTDATLSDIQAHDGTTQFRVRPGFAPTHHDYEVRVPDNVSQVTLWPLASNVAARVAATPADADPFTAGHQVLLAPVAAGEPDSETVVGIVVTSADMTASETYLVTVVRQAPLTDSYSFLQTELPQGCHLNPLLNTDSGVQPSAQWLSSCRSILEYDEWSSHHNNLTTGLARFYRFKALSDGDVAITMTDYDTSHHYVLRESDGTLVEHVFYHKEFPGQDCTSSPDYSVPCAAHPRLEATLEAGDYLLELVQHYSTTGRQRWFRFEVEGDVLHADDPLLDSVTVDGTALPGFDSGTFKYLIDRTGAQATIAATAATATPAHSVTIQPADAGTAAGHQVDVAAKGITDVWITVVESSGLKANRYLVRFFGDPPDGTPLTAQLAGVPAEHDATTRIAFQVHFSEPVQTTRQSMRDSALTVTGGTVHNAHRAGPGRSDRWRFVIKPDSSGPVTVTLPATTSCATDGAICSFFGKRLSNTATVVIPGPPG